MSGDDLTKTKSISFGVFYFLLFNSNKVGNDVGKSAKNRYR